jgi:hypothetical protein
LELRPQLLVHHGTVNRWARDIFEGWFATAIEDVNSYLSNPGFLEDLGKEPVSELETL